MKLTDSISKKSVLRRNIKQIFTDVDNEIIMLNIERGEYYSLNEVGSFIWNELKEPITLSKLIEELIKTFSVPEQECVNDTIEYLNELIKRNLVEVVE